MLEMLSKESKDLLSEWERWHPVVVDRLINYAEKRDAILMRVYLTPSEYKTAKIKLPDGTTLRLHFNWGSGYWTRS